MIVVCPWDSAVLRPLKLALEVHAVLAQSARASLSTATSILYCQAACGGWAGSTKGSLRAVQGKWVRGLGAHVHLTLLTRCEVCPPTP